MSGFFDMPASSMTTLAFLMGMVFIDDLNANEQNTLGNFLMLIAQTLITNATQLQALQTPLYAKDYTALREEVKRLEQMMNKK